MSLTLNVLGLTHWQVETGDRLLCVPLEDIDLCSVVKAEQLIDCLETIAMSLDGRGCYQANMTDNLGKDRCLTSQCDVEYIVSPHHPTSRGSYVRKSNSDRHQCLGRTGKNQALELS